MRHHMTVFIAAWWNRLGRDTGHSNTLLGYCPSAPNSLVYTAAAGAFTCTLSGGTTSLGGPYTLAYTMYYVSST